MKTKYQKLQLAAEAQRQRNTIYPEGEEMLDNAILMKVLEKFAPGVDAAGDGIFGLTWTSTTTFYRHTEEYVAQEQRLAYKYELERAFPGKSGVL